MTITLVGWVVFAVLATASPWPVVAAYGAGAALVAVISWLDDLHSLSSRTRLLAHSISAAIAIVGIGYFQRASVPLIGQATLGWLGLPITFLWVVGLTNAYNFMDGIDGLAGSQAVVAALGWAVLGRLSGQPQIAMLGLLIAGASLGFLGHNWPPARIFMGDVGSAFLGYTFAVLPVLAAQTDPHLALPGVLFVWPFIFDAGFTFLRRLRRGENVFAAHRSHLYQRLVISGASHRRVTLLYTTLSVVGVVTTLGWLRDGAAGAFLVTASIPSLCAALWILVSHRERTFDSKPHVPGSDRTRQPT